MVGEISRDPIGSYSYRKRLRNGALVPCEVRVFSLEVKRQQRSWPEKGNVSSNGSHRRTPRKRCRSRF